MYCFHFPDLHFMTENFPPQFLLIQSVSHLALVIPIVL
jgi:hypothetical protein